MKIVMLACCVTSLLKRAAETWICRLVDEDGHACFVTSVLKKGSWPVDDDAGICALIY